jgi:hypothetical protein
MEGTELAAQQKEVEEKRKEEQQAEGDAEREEDSMDGNYDTTAEQREVIEDIAR